MALSDATKPGFWGHYPTLLLPPLFKYPPLLPQGVWLGELQLFSFQTFLMPPAIRSTQRNCILGQLAYNGRLSLVGQRRDQRRRISKHGRKRWIRFAPVSQWQHQLESLSIRPIAYGGGSGAQFQTSLNISRMISQRWMCMNHRMAPVSPFCNRKGTNR